MHTVTDLNLSRNSGSHQTHSVQSITPIVSARSGTRHHFMLSTCKQTSNESRLLRNTGIQISQNLIRRTSTQRRNRLRTQLLTRNEHVTRLENSQVLETTRQVTLQYLNQARQQRAAHPALSRRNRVLQANRRNLSHRVLRGAHPRSRPQVVRISRHEGVRENLSQARSRQRIQRTTLTRLLRSVTATRRSHRQSRGDVLVTVNTCDFLSQVLLRTQVSTPRRDSHRVTRLGTLHRAANLTQARLNLLRRVIHANTTGSVISRQVNHDRLITERHISNARLNLSTSQLNQQLNRTLSSRSLNLRIHATLKTLRGLRNQLVTASGTSHRHFIKTSRLHQNAGGRIGHLSRSATHHTGKTNHAGIISNDNILGVQSTLNTVQGHQLLASSGATHHNLTLNLVSIVEVQRLAGLQHHVVRNIHRQRQRAHTRQTQTRRHPRRNRRIRLHARHLTHHETSACGVTVNRGVITQSNRVTGLVRLRGALAVRQHKILKRRTGSVAPLASNTAQRERVTAVRGHVHLSSLIVQAQQLHRIGTKLRVQAQSRKHQNAVVIITNTQLTSRSNHASRLVAVGLTSGNRETTGQNSAGQGYNNLVAGYEIVGTTNNALNAGRLNALTGQSLLLAFRNHTHLAPVHGLAVRMGLRLHREHLTNHNRAG